jgi:hypothetical protein
MADPNDIEDRPTPNRRREIDRISRASGFGRTYGAVADVYNGLDHRNAGAAFQKNTDHQGLTLFTRPQLNLTYNNVLADRQLLPLLAEEPGSMYRAIRSMLDPKLGLSSRLFDQKQAFMTILTNTLVNVSGFPDLTINAYTAPEGMRKESYSIVDDVAEINNTFDITASFANIEGDPITALFHYWSRYMGNVYSGLMVPYPDKVIENEIDYQCRVWRLVLDKSKRFVKKIGCANVAFPMSSPLGNAFNFANETPYSDANDQISIPFRCVGAEYQDPILYNEFNLTVAAFNPGMYDENRINTYQKLKPSEIDAFNFNGYPRIDPVTLELEWYVSMEDYVEVFS